MVGLACRNGPAATGDIPSSIVTTHYLPGPRAPGVPRWWGALTLRPILDPPLGRARLASACGPLPRPPLPRYPALVHWSRAPAGGLVALHPGTKPPTPGPGLVALWLGPPVPG